MQDDFNCEGSILVPLSMPDIVIANGETKIMAMPCGGGPFLTSGVSEGSPATKRCLTTRSRAQFSETVRVRVLNAKVGIDNMADPGDLAESRYGQLHEISLLSVNARA